MWLDYDFKMATRKDIPEMKRVMIKVGTSVITQEDGTLALGRMSNIVEQISELKAQGKEVVLVSSGSVTHGAKKLESIANGKDLMELRRTIPRVCAAAGQSTIMSMYENLFAQKHLICSQLLLTESDFQNKERRHFLRNTINTLLSMDIVPIVNENDVTRYRSKADDLNRDPRYAFLDNDSLACLISRELDIQLVVLLSDVRGVYKRPPSELKSMSKKEMKKEILDTFPTNTDEFIIGKGSNCGRGGMQAKIDASLRALEEPSVEAVVIASGFVPNTISKVCRGEIVGTLFTKANLSSTSLRSTMESSKKSKGVSTPLQANPTSLKSKL